MRVGKYTEPQKSTCERLGTEVICIPAEEYNSLFDSIKPDDAMQAAAMQFKRDAMEVMDVTDHYFIEAFRAHKTVCTLLDRHDADAITIDCLMLVLVPCRACWVERPPLMIGRKLKFCRDHSAVARTSSCTSRPRRVSVSPSGRRSASCGAMVANGVA